jgi:hypothetical protein
VGRILHVVLDAVNAAFVHSVHLWS